MGEKQGRSKKIAIFPAFFDCCTEVAQHIPKRWLRRVVKFEIQKSGDLCRIPAVILHTRRKKLCVSSLNKTVKRWMKHMTRCCQNSDPKIWTRRKLRREKKTLRKDHIFAMCRKEICTMQ
ncbi:C-C motif chemokine 28 isoform X2 [Pantherophis guttatus]|uniref:C-C motif chemokine n=1 Tax=Pantherophis guttatus TaxID=94885 RepID=A0ABM3ZCW8_PANGU|nr:C-C motif chemokine 28 isoform X2 [Pantherophis guttatus]